MHLQTPHLPASLIASLCTSALQMDVLPVPGGPCSSTVRFKATKWLLTPLPTLHCQARTCFRAAPPADAAHLSLKSRAVAAYASSRSFRSDPKMRLSHRPWKCSFGSSHSCACGRVPAGQQQARATRCVCQGRHLIGRAFLLAGRLCALGTGRTQAEQPHLRLQLRQRVGAEQPAFTDLGCHAARPPARSTAALPAARPPSAEAPPGPGCARVPSEARSPAVAAAAGPPPA